MSVVVRCHGVTRTYGKGPSAVQALRGVDLEVRAGEMLLLAGPSGCGKSTLLSIIGAMLDRDAGDCEITGSDPQAMSRSERARFRGACIGFVFQSFNLLPALTAEENVAVPLLIAGSRRRPALARAQQLLGAVGLGNRERTVPGQLSGGEQQRVAIARALARDPALLICDEPTSNLDHDTGTAVIDLLRKAGRGVGRAVIVATHDARLLDRVDRVAWMDDGRITRVRAPPTPASRSDA